ARVEQGDRVAVIGAGGGVGSYAIQIAKAVGAEVTAVCGPTKVDGIRRLGIENVIDHTRQDLSPEPRDRFDVVIDTAGKTPLRQLRQALTGGGRLVIVGADHGHRITGGLGRWLLALAWSPFVGQTLRPFAARPVDRVDLDHLRGLMDDGTLVPVVDRTFSLAETADAMRYLDHRTAPGKVVITV
ncbi:MAG: zinc-binding dehydrogenase, partial [Acidimicrobiales bacterium]